MKILLLIPVFLFLATPAWAVEVGERFQARVVEVKDGDTIVVVRGNDTLDLITIRLYGIDAPEDGQPYGKQAARALRKMVGKKVVEVEVMQKRDRYKRVVGVVRHKGEDVGRKLLADGWAWVDYRHCKPSRLCRGYWVEVRRAQQKGSEGLWKSALSVPPWEWRRVK